MFPTLFALCVRQCARQHIGCDIPFVQSLHPLLATPHERPPRKDTPAFDILAVTAHPPHAICHNGKELGVDDVGRPHRLDTSIAKDDADIVTAYLYRTDERWLAHYILRQAVVFDAARVVRTCFTWSNEVDWSPFLPIVSSPEIMQVFLEFAEALDVNEDVQLLKSWLTICPHPDVTAWIIAQLQQRVKPDFMDHYLLHDCICRKGSTARLRILLKASTHLKPDVDCWWIDTGAWREAQECEDKESALLMIRHGLLISERHLLYAVDRNHSMEWTVFLWEHGANCDSLHHLLDVDWQSDEGWTNGVELYNMQAHSWF